ncbi:MAG TPA: DMT family transporter [Alkalispirochaeta sp.]|nr:DMT family transporter [Alkalispirochaeta sp.]
MTVRILLAITAALGTGFAIAMQATLNGRAGGIIGPFHTGLLVNIAGGVISVLVIGGVALTGHLGIGAATLLHGRVLLPVTAAGFFGILIIMGVAFSVSNVGVTAGLAAVILSQLLFGLLLDRVGAASSTGIAIDIRRILGVVAMAAGVWLLVPNSS